MTPGNNPGTITIVHYSRADISAAFDHLFEVEAGESQLKQDIRNYFKSDKVYQSSFIKDGFPRDEYVGLIRAFIEVERAFGGKATLDWIYKHENNIADLSDIELLAVFELVRLYSDCDGVK